VNNAVTEIKAEIEKHVAAVLHAAGIKGKLV